MIRQLFLITISSVMLAGSGCRHAQSQVRQAKSGPSAAHRAAAGNTIADVLLGYEMGHENDSRLKARLHDVIEDAVERFGNDLESESEKATAIRFFHAVDAALIDHNFIFPPDGLIDLLRNALKPRALSLDEFQRAAMLPANTRRLPQMKRNFLDQREFLLADCDLSAIIYKAAGERLGLPIEFVLVPKHNFARWSSATLRLNWDSNDGRSYTDDEYAKRWGATATGRERLGWLGDMPETDIRSYWWRMIGNWHKRHERYHEAYESFCAATKVSPGNLDSANELAWFLATCPDPKYRNGIEAEKIAKRVVESVPRANWIDTLAAAQSETGNFDAAIATELRAKEAAKTVEWGISAGEEIAGLDKCIEAYRKHLSYRQAVTMGLIDDPREILPYDD